MSADIFISFASQDAKVASTICTALENRGFTCWISGRDIHPGENFQSAIVRAIRSAKVLLLVFTANSNRSDEMTKELALASQQKLMVVPLRVENVTPSDAFAYEFATRQWIDLFSDWEQAINNLCTRLTAALEDDRTHVDTIVLGKPSLVDSAATATLSAVRKRRALMVGVAVAVALVGVAGLAMPWLFGKPAAAVDAAALATPAAPATVAASVADSAPAASGAGPAAPEVPAPAAVTAHAAPASADATTAPKPVHHTSHKTSSKLPY
jgi:hypothetical protein